MNRIKKLKATIQRLERELTNARLDAGFLEERLANHFPGEPQFEDGQEITFFWDGKSRRGRIRNHYYDLMDSGDPYSLALLYVVQYRDEQDRACEHQNVREEWIETLI